MRGLSIAFKPGECDFGTSRVIAGETTLPCGCRLRHAARFPTPSDTDQAREDGKAKLLLIRWFDLQAATHDHDLSMKQQVLRRITRRLKS